MYLLVIAWLYVTLLMALAEAMSTQGTVLGAIITFIFYGLLPMALMVYLMGTPLRRKALRQSEQLAKDQAMAAQQAQATSVQPDASGHAARVTQVPAIPAMGKEELRP